MIIQVLKSFLFSRFQDKLNVDYNSEEKYYKSKIFDSDSDDEIYYNIILSESDSDSD